MLCYCEKCGRIVQESRNCTVQICDYCNHILQYVPEKYCDGVVITKKQKQQLIEECVKSSPEFDQYLFEHRDQDLFNRRMSDQAKLAHGKAIIEGTNRTPKCPTCQSTNIRKMSGVERGVSVATFGLFSRKINKTFKCNHCGYTW